MLTPDQKPSRRADVLVINTESRAMPAMQAGKAVAQALAPWCDGDAHRWFTKIDSTFPRQRGAEVGGNACCRSEAGRDCGGYSRCRAHHAGLCLVNGTPLLETEFASDPKTPITLRVLLN
jgi:uncharacterized protein YgbK (DUF1537 family)